MLGDSLLNGICHHGPGALPYYVTNHHTGDERADHRPALGPIHGPSLTAQCRRVVLAQPAHEEEIRDDELT
jgi:hypothetical protein